MHILPFFSTYFNADYCVFKYYNIFTLFISNMVSHLRELVIDYLLSLSIDIFRKLFRFKKSKRNVLYFLKKNIPVRHKR